MRTVELTTVPAEQQLADAAAHPGKAERAMRKRHRLIAELERQQREHPTAYALWKRGGARRAGIPLVPLRAAGASAVTASNSSPSRASSRPRERREARHQARSTSSGDSGSDSDEPEPPRRRLTVYIYGFGEAVA